uniref:ALMS_motif domain-containing protein n=1 Tax=Glossina austeni TaxID=7395 RepID=A0A1A9VD81_GLOAU
MLKVPPSTKQMASISKSTSIIITKESNDLSLNICNYNGKNTGKTEKGYNELSKNVGENNLWKLPPLSTKIKSLSQVLKSEKKRDIYSNLHVDLAQPTMRECLNPMTKSEGEYERKQRNERLSWIENEIRGLQRLKRLLLYQDSSPVESNTTQSCIQDRIKRRVVIETQPQSKNLYYSVDTESHEKGETKTYKSPEIIEKNKIQDIEVVIDESIGDVVNLNNNLKRTKGRRKETQLIYENPSDVMTATEQLSVIPRFRSIRKGIIVTEEQLLGDDVDDNHGKTKHPEKIGSPTLTCKIKDNNDTLQDLILQRKQNFIELHKNKRQSHYETWKQRQKERGQYELPSVQRVTDSPLPSSASQKSSDLREEALSTTASRLTHVIYTSAAMHASSQQVRRNLQQDAVTASTTTTSSLSLFCVSSDMSVPSGSENSSSTPTTTHQYDDVADTGVGIQTREAMLRSYPIYDLQRCKNLHAKRIGCTLRVCKTCLSTSRAQVKSKGIAYVIEFNDDEKPDDGNKDQAPPDKCSNMNKSLPKTTTTYLTENIKLFHKDRKAQRVTLQEHLENCLPKFLRHTKKREDLLKARQAVRVERRRQLKEIIDNASFTSLEKHIKLLPPAPIENLRIVNTKQIKAWTDKRFAKLPEVVEKRRRVREERDRRNSRILRHLFNQGLQQRVLDRRISLSHSRTVV